MKRTQAELFEPPERERTPNPEPRSGSVVVGVVAVRSGNRRRMALRRLCGRIRATDRDRRVLECVFRSKVITDSGGNVITFAVRTGMVQGA